MKLLTYLMMGMVRSGMSQIFNLGEISEECGGSLHIHGVNGNDYVFTSTDASIPHPGIMATAVSMEGCGCYTLYQGQGRRGRAFFVTRRGRQNIPLGRVGSLYKHRCGLQGYRNNR